MSDGSSVQSEFSSFNISPSLRAVKSSVVTIADNNDSSRLEEDRFSVQSGFSSFNISPSLRAVKSSVVNIADNNCSPHLEDDRFSATSSHYLTGDDNYSDRDDSLYSANSSCVKNSSKSQHFLTCRQHMSDEIYSKMSENNSEEIENMKRKLEAYKKRVECMSKVNDGLRRDLKKTIKNNLLLDECLICPYTVEKNGELTFPGKKDLDKELEIMFREVENIKQDLKIFENDELTVCKLKKVLNSSLLSRCFNNCCGTDNERITVSRRESSNSKFSYENT